MSIYSYKYILFCLVFISVLGIYLKFKVSFQLSSPSNIGMLSFLSKNEGLKEILESSDEQRLLDESILMQSIKFMLQDTDEYDPKLIDFVRSIIHYPSKNKLINLNNKKRTDFSQIGQSRFIDQLLGSKRNGFFIEAGGFDGEDLSNSLFFEIERNWTGILIEPVPSLYKSIVSKNRNIYSINACIAKQKPVVSKFRVASALTGRLDSMHPAHSARIDKQEGKKLQLLYVPCFSLNTILTAIGVNSIDYFSLDVEGGEMDVLKSIKFDRVHVKTLTIEHNGFEDIKNTIVAHLTSNGYSLAKSDHQDAYFIKK